MNRTYTTVQGDAWDLIAHSQLGGVEYTDRLMNLNQRYLGYYVFPAGVVLVLPAVELAVSGALPPWRGAAG